MGSGAKRGANFTTRLQRRWPGNDRHSAAEESNAHPAYVAALIAAQATDTVPIEKQEGITLCEPPR